MKLTNSKQSYGTVTKTFHWLTAILIFTVIPLGVIAYNMPYDTDAQLSRKALLFSLHKTVGVAIFFVALLRILWAFTQEKPGPLHPERTAETTAAEIVHWLLYGSLVLAPLSGWIHHAATSGFAPIWWPFGQNLPFVPVDESVAKTFGALHWIWTKVMAASLLLHIAGAVKHQVVDKDATLRRMWFGETTLPPVAAHMSKLSAPVVALVVFAGTGAAMTLVTEPAEAIETAELADVDSGWTVLDGSLGIAVQQFGSRVEGQFADWTADITFDPESKSGSVEVVIAIGSLTLGSVTNEAMGAQYFDLANHPQATFTGAITNVDGENFVSEGTLTIKGLPADVTLQFTLTENDGVWSMDGQTSVDRRSFDIGEDGEGNVGFGVEIFANLTAQVAE